MIDKENKVKELEAEIKDLKTQAENKDINNIKLNSCLSEVDDSFMTAFRILCMEDVKIGGSAEKCSGGGIENVLSFVSASIYRSKFTGLVDKRDKEREECIELYK